MNKQEKLAREWAENLRNTDNYEGMTDRAKAAIEFVLDNIPPTTMADVEWDDDAHYLAGAVCEVEGAREVVVMVAPRHDGQILCLNAEVSGAWLTPLPSNLTPNGKRYTLMEEDSSVDLEYARLLLRELARDHNLGLKSDFELCAQLNAIKDTLDGDDPKGPSFELRKVKKPVHPTTLTTEEDYENAPEGTVVAFRNGRGVEQKYYENDWRYTGFAQSDSDIDMCGTPRHVLRWGWGE